MQLQQAQQMISRQKAQISGQRKALRKQQQVVDQTRKTLKMLFNEDQMKALGRKSNRGVKWSTETIQKGLRTKFVCSSRGYDVLLEQGQPLPSQRTLRRSLEDVKFASGVLDEMFILMKTKVSAMKETERECCITLDEMTIESKIEWDKALDQLTGYVNLPRHSGKANHALVFMLSGISTRWKQVVAYYYTGSSTNGSVLKDIILSIITKAEHICLNVTTVTSDMGAANQKMWSSFGISVTKSSRIHSIVHPLEDNRKLYFMSDPPHVLKNIRNFLISDQTITLPPVIVSNHALPSDSVNIGVVRDLWKAENQAVYKLGKNLSEEMIKPGQFDKMKAVLAKQLFDKRIEAAIIYFVKECDWSEECKTTVWFLGLVRRWFDLMTSRNPKLALSRFDRAKYDEAIKFLRDVIEVFQLCMFGGRWKPIQTAVIMSTLSVLDIQETFLNDGHLFLLTSRLTQDCLENIFSCVRHKHATPTALQLKYDLRLVAMGQYLHTARNGSYDPDNTEHLVDLSAIQLLKKERMLKEQNDEKTDEDDADCIQQVIPLMQHNEYEALKYIAGYCVKHLHQNCEPCMKFCKSQQLNEPIDFISLTSFKEGCLVRPSQEVVSMLLYAENHFIQKEKHS